MTATFIQKSLFKKFISHKYRFINLYYFDNESDWLSFLPSGFCYEVEIKVSRSDFFKDFKKIRHEIHLKKESKNEYYVERLGEIKNHHPSWELTAEYPELVEAKEHLRYNRRTAEYEPQINLSITLASVIEFKKVNNQNLPNKFFYAVPEGLIKENELPDYAGLLYITKDGEVNKVKDGKFIYKDILSPTKVFNKVYFKYEEYLIEKLKN